MGLLLSLALGGCFYAVSDQTVDPGWARQEWVLEQIEPGKTEETWVLETLGKPASRAQRDDGVAVLSYRFGETVENRLWLFPLSARERTQTEHELCFEVKDGLVQRHWRRSTPVAKHSKLE